MLERLHELGNKLSSIKGLAFGFATAFFIIDKIDSTAWLVFTLILLAFRAFEKVFDPNR